MKPKQITDNPTALRDAPREVPMRLCALAIALLLAVGCGKKKPKEPAEPAAAGERGTRRGIASPREMNI
jgi:hypothetical protein